MAVTAQLPTMLAEVKRLREARLPGRDLQSTAERQKLVRDEIEILRQMARIQPSYKRDLALALRRLAAELALERQPQASRQVSSQAEVILKELALVNMPTYGTAWVSVLLELLRSSPQLSWHERSAFISHCVEAAVLVRGAQLPDLLCAERDLLRAIRNEVLETTFPVPTEQLDRRIRAIWLQLKRQSIAGIFRRRR